jgi:23S rRNA (adenine2503-C2)-methyltransferase
MSANLPSILGTSLDALTVLCKEHGHTAFRAKQVMEWIYKKRVESFDEMTNLPVAFRDWIKTIYGIYNVSPAKLSGSTDTTKKYLIRLVDGRFIETVSIPANPNLYGETSDRHTLCVSSQVGCAYDCKFCASGLAGFTRNLTAAEIIQQVLLVEKETGKRVDNIVFMGMGEPLANFTHLNLAIESLNAHWGVNIGARHMTVSTSGLAPQIKKLAQMPIQVRLAISLHGASNSVRSEIMPVNNKYPIEELFEALDVWVSQHKQYITLEYILIQGVNDGLDEAARLAKLALRVKAKVNLIPYNTVEGLHWIRPSEAKQEAFWKVLNQAGVMATLRREKGHDIAAACGQLRLKHETELGIIESPIPEKRITIHSGQ